MLPILMPCHVGFYFCLLVLLHSRPITYKFKHTVHNVNQYKRPKKH